MHMLGEVNRDTIPMLGRGRLSLACWRLCSAHGRAKGGVKLIVEGRRDIYHDPFDMPGIRPARAFWRNWKRHWAKFVRTPILSASLKYHEAVVRRPRYQMAGVRSFGIR